MTCLNLWYSLTLCSVGYDSDGAADGAVGSASDAAAPAKAPGGGEQKAGDISPAVKENAELRGEVAELKRGMADLLKAQLASAQGTPSPDKPAVDEEFVAETQQRIERLQAEFETREETLNRQANQRAEQLTGRITELEQNNTTAITELHNNLFKGQVATACTAEDHRVKGSSTIVESILSPQKVFEKGDDGVTQAFINGIPGDVGEDGKPLAEPKQYTVNEAVKRLTELQPYQHLFEGDLSAGVGGEPNAPGSGGDQEKDVMLNDMGEFMKQRKLAKEGKPNAFEKHFGSMQNPHMMV